MTAAEKIELALVPLCGSGALLSAPLLPDKAGVGTLLLWASVLVLLQALIRDLWLLIKQKSRVRSVPAKSMRCMCIESTVGVTGLLLGLGLLGAGLDRPVEMPSWKWSLLVVAVLLIGFLIKDYVFGWNPLQLRRDRDHANIVFTWKA